MSDDRRNAPIHRTAYILFSASTCPIPLGSVGQWYDASDSAAKFRNADGSDSVIAGASSIPIFAAITKAATALAGSPVYDNGTDGVGATLTRGTAGAIGTIGGVALTSADEGKLILVNDQASTFENGLYTLTNAGSGSVAWVLTRAVGMDQNIIDGSLVAVQQGTYADQVWEQSETVATVGTDAVLFGLSATTVTFAAVQTALAAASSSVGVNGQKITSLANPSANNDAANKSYVDNRYQFSNSNNISIGLSGSTVTASAAFSGVAASGASTVSAGLVQFQNSNNITFGLNGSTITASVGTALSMSNVKYFEGLHRPAAALFCATGSGAINLSFQRVSFPHGISATQLDLLGALTVVANTHVSYTMSACLYSFSGATLSSVSSSTFGVSIDSTVLTNYSGTRFRSMPVSWNITPGEYMLAHMVSMNGPAGTTGSFSFFGQGSVSINGVEGAAENYTAYYDRGYYTAATGAFPSSVTLGQIAISGSASNNNALAMPYFRLLAAGA